MDLASERLRTQLPRATVRDQGTVRVSLCGGRYQVGRARHGRLSHHLHGRRILRGHVRRRRRHRQGTPHARHGGASQGLVGEFRLHDSLYVLYGHHVLRGVWSVGHGVRGRVSRVGIHRDDCGTGGIVLLDGEVSEEFVHCLFNRGHCPPERVFDDDSEFVEHGRLGWAKAAQWSLYGKAMIRFAFGSGGGCSEPRWVLL
mmetsp:Transcript_27639/g.47076  ORF Transcript_27639/g.47076 Transcript_27639/m.47076 type:complete len:200 (-) Transcript_27639:163-762(-)